MKGDSVRNRLDQLRLAFAALVLLAHSFELLGRGLEEPLQRLFGTTNFGTFAVCGFFILSGYLISAAWERTPNLARFLQNRVIPIGPAFVVAFFLTVVVGGALGATSADDYYRSSGLATPRFGSCNPQSTYRTLSDGN